MRYNNWDDIPLDKAVCITTCVHIKTNDQWFEVSFVGEKWWEKKSNQKQKQDGE